ncbi:metallophosphoesterase [Lacticaseibacillus pabuli]|uniref:Phosphoesterase n=1 Tax=Lacticaseibacillus pabuli TaxID=3025672 RepID=A0ABY7WTB0_9LACO|nr:metallophosphoesterase [Lacticaseibacillus sp. KACC 23028]WDF83403.1 metallophosphoesterase [Lacticaseibacillus sp. KACC 23028]
MKILAVSDTHGDAQILKELLIQYPDFDGYFYAGDSELQSSDDLFKTYQAVEGNMDWDTGFPMTIDVTVKGVNVFMTHGHKYGVGIGLDRLVAAGREQGAQLIIYGHTHVALAEQHEGIVVVNPGSISQPRGELANLGGTYALIEFKDGTATVEYGGRKGMLPQLNRTFKL